MGHTREGVAENQEKWLISSSFIHSHESQDATGHRLGYGLGVVGAEGLLQVQG